MPLRFSQNLFFPDCQIYFIRSLAIYIPRKKKAVWNTAYGSQTDSINTASQDAGAYTQLGNLNMKKNAAGQQQKFLCSK